METNRTVVVLGASPKPERYSNKAVRLLKELGYHVIPIHPAVREIEGLPVLPNLSSIQERVSTITVYISPQKGEQTIKDMIALKPGRIILNPGTESRKIEADLEKSSIKVLKVCTLVLLKTGQF